MTVIARTAADVTWDFGPSEPTVEAWTGCDCAEECLNALLGGEPCSGIGRCLRGDRS